MSKKTHSADITFANNGASYYVQQAYFGDNNEALIAINKAIDIAPQESYFYYRKATILDEQMNFLKALNVIDEAIKLDPTNSYFYARKAEILQHNGQMDDALKTIDIAILFRDNINFYYNENVPDPYLDNLKADIQESKLAILATTSTEEGDNKILLKTLLDFGYESEMITNYIAESNLSGELAQDLDSFFIFVGDQGVAV